MKSGLQLIPYPNNKKREGQCFLQIHSALVCLWKHPEELTVRSSEPGSASGLLLLLPTCCVRRQEGSKQVGGEITGTATGLSQAAGASEFPLTPFPTGINPLETAEPHLWPFSTTSVVNLPTQRKDLCCVWGSGAPCQGCYDSTVRFTIRPSLSMAKL